MERTIQGRRRRRVRQIIREVSCLWRAVAPWLLPVFGSGVRRCFAPPLWFLGFWGFSGSWFFPRGASPSGAEKTTERPKPGVLRHPLVGRRWLQLPGHDLAEGRQRAPPVLVRQSLPELAQRECRRGLG